MLLTCCCFILFIQCRNVVWLPGSLSEASVTENTCTSCGPGCFLEFFFSCTGLDNLILYIFFYVWFPDFQRWHSGPVYKIQFRFRRLEIPPNYSAQHIGKMESRSRLSLPKRPYPFLLFNGTLNSWKYFLPWTNVYKELQGLLAPF